MACVKFGKSTPDRTGNRSNRIYLHRSSPPSNDIDDNDDAAAADDSNGCDLCAEWVFDSKHCSIYIPRNEFNWK